MPPPKRKSEFQPKTNLQELRDLASTLKAGKELQLGSTMGGKIVKFGVHHLHGTISSEPTIKQDRTTGKAYMEITVSYKVHGNPKEQGLHIDDENELHVYTNMVGRSVCVSEVCGGCA